MCEVIQSGVMSTSGFDENIDLITTYLGRTDMDRVSNIK